MATAPAGSIAQSSTLYISCWYSSHFENDMSDLCSLAEGGGGGGGGGGAASVSPFSWREEVVIHIIRAVLRCTTLPCFQLSNLWPASGLCPYTFTSALCPSSCGISLTEESHLKPRTNCHFSKFLYFEPCQWLKIF